MSTECLNEIVVGQVTVASDAPGSLAERINAAHERCLVALNDGLDHALEAGLLLSEAKEKVPHGEFQKWVTENCTFSHRAARNYLRVFTHWGEIEAKRHTCAVLGRQGALRLVSEAKPRPAEPDDVPDDVPAFPIPGVGEALWGKSKWSTFVMAESLNHIGYVNYFVINSQPTGPESGGYVVAGSRGCRASRASEAMQGLLREEHLDASEVEWEIVTDPDEVANIRECAEEEAALAYDSKNYWWKHR